MLEQRSPVSCERRTGLEPPQPLFLTLGADDSSFRLLLRLYLHASATFLNLRERTVRKKMMWDEQTSSTLSFAKEEGEEICFGDVDFFIFVCWYFRVELVRFVYLWVRLTTVVQAGFLPVVS